MPTKLTYNASALKLPGAVRSARVKRKLTQLQLANAIGLKGEGARCYISRVESGTQMPRLARLLAIAEALGVELQSLIS